MAGYSFISSRYRTGAQRDTRYQAVRIAASYQVSERMSVSLTVLRQQQDYGDVDTGTGNVAQLGFSWRRTRSHFGP